MPLDVAMEQPNTGVVGLEADNSIATSVDSDGVSLGRDSGEVSSVASVNSLVACWSFTDLELMTVQMKRVDCGVKVVYHDLHNVPFVDNERIYGTVNIRIGVRAPSGNRSEQGWHLLGDIGNVVEIGSKFESVCGVS